MLWQRIRIALLTGALVAMTGLSAWGEDEVEKKDAPKAEAPKVLQCRFTDCHRASAQSQSIAVVEYDDAVVGREPEIAFDPRAELERGGKGDQAVLGKLRAKMQAPMGEARRPGIERIRA